MIQNKLMSEITVHNKYAKFIPEKNRRESWEEIVTRNKDMHIKKFPKLKEEINKAYSYVYDKKILPSMRSMQFAGKPIDVSPNRIFNCAYLPIDHKKAFSEIMFLLLGGTGVGYSVQKKHTEKLPSIRKLLSRRRRFLIGDSIEGWSDAVNALMKAYFKGLSKPDFDFSDIRPKGARLVTSGGKAPGPQPLKVCLLKIDGILSQKQVGSKLTPLEVHDIVCHIANAVLAGGIRRAALISLFDAENEEMLTAKSGHWWTKNPQRGRANNSAVLLRNETGKEVFEKVWKRVKTSGSGEPGFFWTNEEDWGTNPCCEISLRPNQFCNLTEVNVSDVKTQKELNERVTAAAFIGTLQASYTDFHYLRSVWKRVTEQDALIGVSMTGIASGAVLNLNLQESAELVKYENCRVADIIGINPASRTTCVKPAGTTSCVLAVSSGIHAWHNDYYIRRMRLNKNESLYKYLLDKNPDLIEDEYNNPSGAVLALPMKAPDGAITRSESAIQMLSRVKEVYKSWVYPGHVLGVNTNNISATVNIKENEWDSVSEWMWENREYYNGLSVLPYDGGTYVQTPFEDCDELTFNLLLSKVKSIDLTEVVEEEDNTDLKGELACAAGACEIF